MKLNFSDPIKKTDLSIQQALPTSKQKKHGSVDAYLKWAPLVAFLALDVFNEQSKDKLEKNLMDAAVAKLLLAAAVQPLKHTLKRQRPDGSSKSFPSNHTSTSFLGSELLRQKLKDKHPVLSYTGYIVSTTTAVLRLYHNKHWFSDVLTGAVLGVLAVKVSPVLIDKIIYNMNIQPAV